MENRKCENCNDILKEVEHLRLELVETRNKYSQICETLWRITNKVRLK